MKEIKLSFPFISFVFAVAVGNAVAHLCTSAMPLQIGALIDGFGLSATAAGVFGFCQVGALALGMILFAPVSHRYRPVYVCLTGLGIAASTNLALYASPPNFILICLLGTLSGFGYCLMLSATVGAPAGWPQADRVYAATSSGGLLILVAVLALLPFANAQFGVRGIFIGIAAILVLCIPLLWGFRYAHPGGAATRLPTAPIAGGLPLLIMWALVSLGSGAMWTFAERIGHALHLSGPVIGSVISTGVFLSLLGSGLAALIGDRIDRRISLGIGLFGTGASCLLMVLSTGLWSYAAAIAFYWIFTILFYVMMLGTAAVIDPSGRLATLGTGVERLAYAFGAPIGGLFVDFGSFLWIGIFAVGTCSVLAPICLAGLNRSVRRAKDPVPIDGLAVPLP